MKEHAGVRLSQAQHKSQLTQGVVCCAVPAGFSRRGPLCIRPQDSLPEYGSTVLGWVVKFRLKRKIPLEKLESNVGT